MVCVQFYDLRTAKSLYSRGVQAFCCESRQRFVCKNRKLRTEHKKIEQKSFNVQSKPLITFL